MHPIHQRWTFRVELRADRRVELRAELDGRPASPAQHGPCTIHEALQALERWLGSDQNKLLSLSVHLSGRRYEMATPRVRVAVYFVMSILERELMRSAPSVP